MRLVAVVLLATALLASAAPAAVTVRTPVDDGIPSGATIGYARLQLDFDGVCVAPRLLAAPCTPNSYVLAAHRIASADWYHEREVEFDTAVEDETVVEGSGAPQWLVWDLTALVRAWFAGEAENDGVLISPADWQEDFDVSGPYPASMSFADATKRPRLVIGYVSPTGPAP